MSKKRKDLDYDSAIEWLASSELDLPEKKGNYKTPEAAKILNCIYGTVERMISAGLLPEHRINDRGDLIIPHTDIVLFLESRASQKFTQAEIEEMIFSEGVIKPRDLVEPIKGTIYDVLYLVRYHNLVNFNVSASTDPFKPYYILPRLRTKSRLEEIRESLPRESLPVSA